MTFVNENGEIIENYARPQNAKRPVILHQLSLFPDPFIPIVNVILPSVQVHSFVTKVKRHRFRSVTPPIVVDWLKLAGWIDVWDCHEPDGRRLRLLSSTPEGKSVSIPIFSVRGKISAEIAGSVFGLQYQISGSYWDEVIALFSTGNRRRITFFQYDWWSSGTVLTVPTVAEEF